MEEDFELNWFEYNDKSAALQFLGLVEKYWRALQKLPLIVEIAHRMAQVSGRKSMESLWKAWK
jgi:hypothetical protein